MSKDYSVICAGVVIVSIITFISMVLSYSWEHKEVERRVTMQKILSFEKDRELNDMYKVFTKDGFLSKEEFNDIFKEMRNKSGH